MEIDYIFKKVAETIELSTGFPQNEIEQKHTLFDHLGIDSIDFVDILFELETEFNVELKISDIEKMASEKLGGKPYEANGMITTEGLIALSEFLPNLDASQYEDGLTVHKMTQMVSVFTLCKMVQFKIMEVQKEQ